MDGVVARAADHEGLPSFGCHERRPRRLVRSGSAELGEFGDVMDHHGASVLTQLAPSTRASAAGELAVGVLDGDLVTEEPCRVGTGVGDERLVGGELQSEFVAQEPGQLVFDGLGFSLRFR